MDDLSSLIGNYYAQAGTQNTNSEYTLGQIVYVPTLEIENRCWIADVQRVDSYAHDKVTLLIRKQKDSDFMKARQQPPIKALELSDGHEITLNRAKLRPCLILGKTDPFDISSLPMGVERNKALNAVTQQYILAPMYSVSTPDKQTSFGATITARIKCLMYPRFFYMPIDPVAVKKESILRLDHCFSNPLAAGVKSTSTILQSKALAYIHEQIKILIGHAPSDEFLESRELLLALLPEEYQA